MMQYLKKNYLDSAEAAVRAYGCFESYGENVNEYAPATAFVPESCEKEVHEMLVKFRQKYVSRVRNSGDEVYFNAEQNAIVAENAKLYYRTMMRGGAESCNVRDLHMMETLSRLMKFHGDGAKSVVWAHNTHILATSVPQK